MKYKPYKAPANDKEHEKLYNLIQGEHVCLVCGEVVLEDCMFTICPVCGWEDNMVQDMVPDFIGGPNHVSLNQAHKAWIEERRGYPWEKEQIANEAEGDDMEDEEGNICPICGEYQFESDNDFDICDVCGWENDGVQFDDHNLRGANHMTVNEARKAWKEGRKIY